MFQVHGVDAAGQVVIRRKLKRRYVLAFFQKLPPCLVGIEACASSHSWARELQALGHTVRLMPPAYVKPYVKRQKNDMHKESNKLATQYGLIVVGYVNPKNIIAETTISNIAKAQHDVGWASFKTMLAYKSFRNGGSMLEVSEANTSRTCAACECMAGPEGRAGLNKRVWRCDGCGSVHDRDVNAARNILRLGLQALVAGASVAAGNPGLQAGE